MESKPDRETEIDERLVTLARESRGLTQKDLASAVGVRQGTLSKIESGLAPASDEFVEALSLALAYPVGFFRREAEIFAPGPGILYHRRKRRLSAKTLNRVKALLNIRRLEVQELLKSVEFPVCEIPDLAIDDYNGGPAEIAKTVRGMWMLPDGPVPNLIKCLEDHGTVILKVDFETSDLDAVSQHLPGVPPIVLVNSRSPIDRLRFTLAHELGHLVMHGIPSQEMEAEADRFAAEFLMPQREIGPNFRGKLTLKKLSALKIQWKVSMAALIRRSQDLGYTSAGGARYLWIQMSRAGYRPHEPVALDSTGEVPALASEVLDVFRNDLGYGEDELSKLLRLAPEEVRSVYGGHTGLRLL